MPSVFGLPGDWLGVQVPHHWDGLNVRGGGGEFMVEVGLVSGLHSEVLTSEGTGENSQTEADTL